jgi:hypothetical protein
MQVGQLVAEKELKLKLLLRMMGTKDTSMWLSWYIVFTAVALVATFVTCIAVQIFQFEYVSKNDFGLVFFLFFLTYMANSAVASACATFLRSMSGAPQREPNPRSPDGASPADQELTLRTLAAGTVGLTACLIFLVFMLERLVTGVLFTDLLKPVT